MPIRKYRNILYILDMKRKSILQLNYLSSESLDSLFSFTK